MTLNKLKPGLELPIYALEKKLELQEQDTYKAMSTSRMLEKKELLDASLEDKLIGKQHRELLSKLLPIARRMENSLKLGHSQHKEHALTYTR